MKETFNKAGFVLVPNMIENVQQYRSCVPKQTGLVVYDRVTGEYLYDVEEPQVPGSFARTSFPQYQQLYYEIKKKVEDILELKLYPTYYFDRFYFAGQELKRHTDRPACEISVSLQINTNAKEPWDLWFTNYSGKNGSVSMNNGDACIYKGTDLPHWRLPLKTKYNKYQQWFRKIRKVDDDTYHHQLFLHYVDANGPFLQYAYDSRC